MSEPASQEITRLLHDWGKGNNAALDELMPIVYDELHRLAGYFMRGQRPGNTLQTTALINEAYLKLVGSSRVNWQNRTHFFAIAAQLMRRILVDSARARNSRKRGGDQIKVTLEENAGIDWKPDINLIALDESLERLAELNERQSKIVELRFFGGLSENEIAELLNISARTVRRDWSAARVWLYRELKQAAEL